MNGNKLQEVAQYVSEIRFRKKTFFGVDESDVWTKIKKLNDKYAEAFMIQEECNKVVLEEKEKRIKDLENLIYHLMNSRGDP